MYCEKPVSTFTTLREIVTWKNYKKIVAESFSNTTVPDQPKDSTLFGEFFADLFAED